MQRKVEEFNVLVNKVHKPMSVLARMLDIQSEVGELSKEVLKATRYGTLPFNVNQDFKMELGDVLYAILSLCDEQKINAQECLDMAIEKMKERLNKKNNLGSGN